MYSPHKQTAVHWDSQPNTSSFDFELLVALLPRLEKHLPPKWWQNNTEGNQKITSGTISLEIIIIKKTPLFFILTMDLIWKVDDYILIACPYKLHSHLQNIVCFRHPINQFTYHWLKPTQVTLLICSAITTKNILQLHHKALLIFPLLLSIFWAYVWAIILIPLD